MDQRYNDQTRQTERADEREKLRPCLRQYLEGKGIDTTKNFRCLNPNHPDRHPSAYYTTGHRVLCRSCGAKYDIFDLVSMELGRPAADRSVFEEVRRRFGQGFSSSPAAAQPQRKAYNGNECMDWNDTIQAETPPKPEPAPPEDFTQFFQECAARISETDYPQRRGLTAETCKRFGLGYAPEWKHKNAKDWTKPTPRLIIPASKYSYTARDTRPDDQIPEYQKGFTKPHIGKSFLYLPQKLYEAGAACIITEGEIDAISIIQSGGSACALRSAAYKTMLFKMLEQKPLPTGKALFLLLDTDDKGQRAQKELADGLRKLGVPFACGGVNGYGIPDGCKDANDMLLQCPDKLKELARLCK